MAGAQGVASAFLDPLATTLPVLGLGPWTRDGPVTVPMRPCRLACGSAALPTRPCSAVPGCPCPPISTRPQPCVLGVEE